MVYIEQKPGWVIHIKRDENGEITVEGDTTKTDSNALKQTLREESIIHEQVAPPPLPLSKNPVR
jgi:ribosome-interacting GTPase 1